MRKSFKKLAVVALFASTSYYSHAQGWYLKPHFGTTLPMISTQFPQFDDAVAPQDIKYDLVNGDTSITNAEGSVAQGIRFGLNAGKMFNENFGFELGVDYLAGKEQNLASTKIITGAGDATLNLVGKIWSIGLTPALVWRGNGETIKPYAKLGLFLPLGGRMTVDATVSDPGTGAISGSPGVLLEQESTLEIKSDFTLGYMGAVGAMYQLNEKLALNMELQVLDFNSVGKEAEFTKYSRTIESPLGTSVTELDDLTTYERKRVYITELTEDSNVEGYSGFDEDKPEDKLATYLNLSSVSINIGVFYTF